MKRIASIAAILENPTVDQKSFNDIVSDHKHLVRGRMGLPFAEEDIAVISLTVIGTMDEINSFTGKLGRIPHTQIKTAVSQKEIN